jgi:hypothetical protein
MTLNAILFCVALWANRSDAKSLVLTLIVSSGVFVPVPWYPAPEDWFIRCILVELIVLSCALMLAVKATRVIVWLSIMLVVAHMIGWYAWYQSEVSEYRFIARMLESAELLSCILFSTIILSKLQSWTSRLIR